MKIHFIAIGGSAMHNLAIALHLKGYEITGSDDEIFDPAKGRLEKYGLLPENIGWQPEKITTGLDAVILGMHARKDNPELLKAKELGVKIYSYPEFLYEQSKDKIRIVVGGSHGKTSITAMIIHVLQQLNIDCDYMVGAQLAGFDVMVRLSETAKIMVIEGDEYLTSPIDRRPKFHLYRPDIGIISGIAWDHINVFPTFDIYIDQFRIFADMIPENGTYIYCKDDAVLAEMSETIDIRHKIPYSIHPYCIQNGVTFLETTYGDIPLKIFGKHNLANLNAARHACLAVGVNENDFYRTIPSFKGASKRLELVAKKDKVAVYKDFAHSPSKLKATIEAVREQFPDRKLVACMELHTFSSLNETFLKEYEGTMSGADVSIVYYDFHALAHKKLPDLEKDVVKSYFNQENLTVYTDSNELIDNLLMNHEVPSVYLFMSSGNFNGVDLNELGNKIVLLRTSKNNSNF
ncbi:MAG: Mur ligase domain-containing protein [Bacteroidales bacterium]|jgi:UDP-N-acetylmuramate: L-alanyl-gamma-D-glutamyl-meso-diaminopimelate ligase|nr:Mur ligase domain-containing protein [Bacteroidales bacterium]